jgi:hypothetical protein
MTDHVADFADRWRIQPAEHHQTDYRDNGQPGHQSENERVGLHYSENSSERLSQEALDKVFSKCAPTTVDHVSAIAKYALRDSMVGTLAGFRHGTSGAILGFAAGAAVGVMDGLNQEKADEFACLNNHLQKR